MEHEFVAVKKFLDMKNAAYKTYEHEPVRTSEEAARIRGEPLSSGVKALIFNADGAFLLLLVPGDRKADAKKIRQLTGKKNIRLATPEEVLQVSNCEVGSVHPFGNLMPGRPKIFMERSILRNERVNFNAGLRTATVRMSPRELKKLSGAEVADIC